MKKIFIKKAKELVDHAEMLLDENPKTELNQQVGSFKLILMCQSNKKNQTGMPVEKIDIKGFHKLNDTEELTRPGLICYNKLKDQLTKTFKKKFDKGNF